MGDREKYQDNALQIRKGLSHGLELLFHIKEQNWVKRRSKNESDYPRAVNLWYLEVTQRKRDALSNGD